MALSNSTNHNRTVHKSRNTDISTSPEPTLIIASSLGHFATIPRIRPFTSPQAPNSYPRLLQLSGLEEKREANRSSRPFTSKANEETQKRSSWYRRLSILPPSVDESVGSPSTQQPSTPSVFSNGSSASPFFGQQLDPVIPRNKLVKRSTSHKRLLNEYPEESSSTPIGKVPTFRRPATSHQRSETLKLRNARKSLAIFDQPKDLNTESWSRKRDRYKLTEEGGSSSGLWRPFFRYQIGRTARDSGTNRTSSAIIFGGADHITSVITTRGENAILVLGNCVDRHKMNFTTPPDSLMEETNVPEQNSVDVKDQNLPTKRTRHSFSIEPRPPTSAPRKLTRGSSLRQGKSHQSRVVERRIVSAPLQTNQQSSTQIPRVSANPPLLLTKFKTLSTFEMGVQGQSSSIRDASEFDDSFGNSDMDSPPGNAFQLQGPQSGLQLQSNSRRTSRVPSDRSTNFGSDNDNSRVFSVDGDDVDHSSETVYDSIRTDASGSSHSGARNYRAEHVFADSNTPKPNKQDLSALPETLSRISLAHENELIIEEEENIGTPIWRERSNEDDMTTPSARRDDNFQMEVTHGANLTKSDTNLSDEGSWDDELGIDTSKTSRSIHSSATYTGSDAFTNTVMTSDPLKTNIFEWSEAQSMEKYSVARPKTSHPQQGMDRGGRPSGRRITNGFHFRSQSVPLPPDSSKHKFNNTKKLDNWMLGNKGVSEDWDNDFEFDEDHDDTSVIVTENSTNGQPIPAFIVPKEILERQATVHGQFGQVKELTLLVEQLRRLHHSATTYGILEGHSSELWKEAAGIIDLATLDEEEPEIIRSSSPFLDFDNFEDDNSFGIPRRSSGSRSPLDSTESKHGNLQNRPRNDSVARAKNVLANIHQHRDPLDPPLEVEEEPVSPTKSTKMPFDTTSLRDLVTRAGVVARACKEIIRKIEDPNYAPHATERRPVTPPDPPFFSQIFQNSPTPSSPSGDRRSPRSIERVTFTTPTPDHNVHGHNTTMMTVV